MAKYETRALLAPDNAVADQITVDEEVLGPIDISDMRDVRVSLVQVTDDGAVALSVQYSLDGTYWTVLDSIAETDFAAADGDVEVVRLANASTVPMPIPAKLLRVVSSGLTGAPAYSAGVSGMVA